MSIATARKNQIVNKPALVSSPQQSQSTRDTRAQLRVIPGGVKNHRATPISIFVASLILSVLGLTMLINTQMAATSFQMHENEIKLGKLMNEQATLISAVQEANSPKKLAERAKKAGLVPSVQTGYISLKEQRVVGGAPAQ